MQHRHNSDSNAYIPGWKAWDKICQDPGRMPGTYWACNKCFFSSQIHLPSLVLQPPVSSPPSTIPYTTTSVLRADKTQLRPYSFASHWFPYFLLKFKFLSTLLNLFSNFLQPHLPSHSAHPPVSCSLNFSNNELLVAYTQTCVGLPT